MKEEKKMKTVKIEVFGYEEFLEPKSTEADMYFDAFSRYCYDHMIFNVEGTQYTPDEFSPAEDILSPEQLKEFKDFDVGRFENGVARVKAGSPRRYIDNNGNFVNK